MIQNTAQNYKNDLKSKEDRILQIMTWCSVFPAELVWVEIEVQS